MPSMLCLVIKILFWTDACRVMIHLATVGLQQGLTLCLYLFALVMNELTRNIQEEVSWCMLFVVDVILIDGTRNGVNAKLELRRDVLESNCFKIS